MATTSFEKRGIAQLTKRLIVNCIRPVLEDLHGGSGPRSKTGDNTDIRVIDAEGRAFSFAEISRISDPEMKALMQTMVDRTFTFLMNLDDPEFMEMMSQLDASIARWDTPQIDDRMLRRKYFRLLKDLDDTERES